MDAAAGAAGVELTWVKRIKVMCQWHIIPLNGFAWIANPGFQMRSGRSRLEYIRRVLEYFTRFSPAQFLTNYCSGPGFGVKTFEIDSGS